MDPARKIELLHQIGELYEVAAKTAKGVATYDRALHEERGSRRRSSVSSGGASSLDRWKDLVKLYQAVAEQVKASQGDPSCRCSAQ